jgi:hypothetical protein
LAVELIDDNNWNEKYIVTLDGHQTTNATQHLTKNMQAQWGDK